MLLQLPSDPPTAVVSCGAAAGDAATGLGVATTGLGVAMAGLESTAAGLGVTIAGLGESAAVLGATTAGLATGLGDAVGNCSAVALAGVSTSPHARRVVESATRQARTPATRGPWRIPIGDLRAVLLIRLRVVVANDQSTNPGEDEEEGRGLLCR